MKKKGATYGSIYGINTHLADNNITAKDIRKAARKLEKPVKGDIINLDTIRRGVRFLSNETKKNLEKDFGAKKTI